MVWRSDSQSKPNAWRTKVIMKQHGTSLNPIIALPFLLLCLFAPSFTAAQEQQLMPQENRLFDSAQADWNNQQWEQAIAKYRLFVQQYPNHPLAADAHF